jgi:hypothetical protein
VVTLSIDFPEDGLCTEVAFGVGFREKEGLLRGVRLGEGKGLLRGGKEVANKGINGVLERLWLCGREGTAVPGKGDFPWGGRTGVGIGGEEVESLRRVGKDGRGCDRPLLEEG